MGYFQYMNFRVFYKLLISEQKDRTLQLLAKVRPSRLTPAAALAGYFFLLEVIRFRPSRL